MKTTDLILLGAIGYLILGQNKAAATDTGGDLSGGGVSGPLYPTVKATAGAVTSGQVNTTGNQVNLSQSVQTLLNTPTKAASNPNNILSTSQMVANIQKQYGVNTPIVVNPNGNPLEVWYTPTGASSPVIAGRPAANEAEHLAARIANATLIYQQGGYTEQQYKETLLKMNGGG
jgi:hypothetical protein